MHRNVKSEEGIDGHLFKGWDNGRKFRKASSTAVQRWPSFEGATIDSEERDLTEMCRRVRDREIASNFSQIKESDDC